MIPTPGRHARGRPSWPVALGVAAVALGLVVAIMMYAGRPTESRGVAMNIAPTQPAPSLPPPPVTDGWPRWGVTHTQFSAAEEGHQAETAARYLLSRVPMLQNQHIMGWGADNPEPAPGKYDFGTLDRRLTFMASAQGQPVITLCCAPDWMKGGVEGRTDWDRNTVAPHEEFFDDYARLAVAVAERYPTVKHFMVWNEFKGFWNNATNSWDAAAYTRLYNTVYDALKAVDKDIKVGGPYIPIDSNESGESELKGEWGAVDQRTLDAIEYWIENKRGADFIVVDGHSATKDTAAIIPDEFSALKKFSAVTTWLREKSGDLPVWWAEWYVAPESADWTEQHRTAVQAVAMMEFATSGVTTALYWDPQQPEGAECPGCLWRPGEGGELPMAGLLSGFTRWFHGGIALEEVTSSDPRVRVLAQAEQMVVVNTASTPVTATVDGTSIRLSPYEIKWEDRGAG
ncbi:Glycosyl hydrolases family 39 [Sinosporangium album]|uniref:Glycosyl hydrolases family 39 n=1 Tax=Sinosporangium album TaxID=504805 RepID=A0A1G8C2G9_9ACTN|nr:xylan 1,4-beta-xylosidase [Sinosporangium album]SDH39518.1 Glycosyl hydrolases family 39 [Sinosporangium album]